MLLLLNSDCGVIKKTLNLDFFLASVWASRHIKCISPPYSHILFWNYKIHDIHLRLQLTLQTRTSYICSTPELSETNFCDGLSCDGLSSQGWLEALLPSHRCIRSEIATSGHIKYWEGIPGFLREPTFCDQTMYPTWPAEELCAMLGQRVRDPLSLLYPSPSGDCLWQSRLVPTLSITTEEAGAMGESSQLHRLLTLEPHHQQTYWQVWTLLLRMPRLSKFHRLAIGEERGTQD